MKTNISYIKLLRNVAPVAAVALLALAMTNCERRDLWVYGDQFKQVLLNIDWRNYMRADNLYPYEPDPDGMTVWYFPIDGQANGRKSYRFTTDEVRHYETYLSAGDYRSVVIDYSPEEYSNQEFEGMEYIETAKVKSARSHYQSDDDQLFGSVCYAGATALTATEPSGLFTIADTPEQMASDTTNIHVNTGKYDDYIPYDEYEEYQATLTKQEFDANPVILPWQMRIRVYVRGIYYLYDTKASIAGLADGYMLALGQTSDESCVHYLDNWDVKVTGDNVGYVVMVFNTWGLRHSMWPAVDLTTAGDFVETKNADPKEVRLNFKFLLRDRKTVKYYHYDIGNLIHIMNKTNEYAMRVDLLDGFTGSPDNQPDLPYVDAVNGAGFDGVVVPWDDGGKAEVTF